MRYFLAFILFATLIARRKLVRMLMEERQANRELVDSILMREKPKLNLRQRIKRK